MSIKQNGGVFGRNPTFNDVTIEGDLIINGEVFTGLDFQGSWNASTNSPSLASSTGTNGEFYIVSVAGTTNLNGITNWGIGDWAIFNGTVWQRVEGGADGNFNDLTANSLTINGTDAVGIDDYILHNGDSNTKFGFSGNDAWKVRTAGVDAVTVDASQNVSIPSGYLGIGTSSPSQKLHVAGGQARFDDDISIQPTKKLYLDGGNDTYINEVGSNTIGFATGGSEKVRIDSQGAVGIGTSSPDAKLVVSKGGTTGAHGDSDLLVRDSSASGSTAQVQILGGNAAYSNLYFSDTDSFSVGGFQYNHSSNYLATRVNNAEAMRIDSSGTLLLAKTVSDNTTVGHRFMDNGFVSHVRDGAEPLILNRLTSDGKIAEFRKDGTTVGGIYATQGRLAIGNGDTGLKFSDSDNSIMAYNVNTGANRDNAVDLGLPAVRFKDLHLSGTANVGGLTLGSNDRIQGTGGLFLGGSSATVFEVGAGSEKMRLDSSGTLLVGKTSTSGSTVGISLKPNGQIEPTADGTYVTYFNRKSSDGVISYYAKDGTTVGSIGVGSGDLVIQNSLTGLRFSDSLDAIFPIEANRSVSDGNTDLGLSNARFKDIYAANGTIQTSDRNEKQDIASLSEAEERVAVAAKSLLKKFRWKDAVEAKGNDARIHFGIIAQDLQSAFEAEGLDAGRYGMFTSNTWWEHDVEVPAIEAVEAVEYVAPIEAVEYVAPVEAVEYVAPIEAQDAVMGERQKMETVETGTYVNLAGETITETQEVGVTEEQVQTVVERQDIDGVMTEVEVERTVSVPVMESYEVSPAVEAVEGVEAVEAVEEVLAVEAVEEVMAVEAVEAADAYTRTDTYDTAEEAPEGSVEKIRMGVRYSELLAFIISAI